MMDCHRKSNKQQIKQAADQERLTGEEVSPLIQWLSGWDFQKQHQEVSGPNSNFFLMTPESNKVLIGPYRGKKCS